jgi:hypothetical protein
MDYDIWQKMCNYCLFVKHIYSLVTFVNEQKAVADPWSAAQSSKSTANERFWDKFSADFALIYFIFALNWVPMPVKSDKKES